jgi:hypothetical protein
VLEELRDVEVYSCHALGNETPFAQRMRCPMARSSVVAVPEGVRDLEEEGNASRVQLRRFRFLFEQLGVVERVAEQTRSGFSAGFLGNMDDPQDTAPEDFAEDFSRSTHDPERGDAWTARYLHTQFSVKAAAHFKVSVARIVVDALLLLRKRTANYPTAGRVAHVRGRKKAGVFRGRCERGFGVVRVDVGQDGLHVRLVRWPGACTGALAEEKGTRSFAYLWPLVRSQVVGRRARDVRGPSDENADRARQPLLVRGAVEVLKSSPARKVKHGVRVLHQSAVEWVGPIAPSFSRHTPAGLVDD